MLGNLYIGTAIKNSKEIIAKTIADLEFSLKFIRKTLRFREKSKICRQKNLFYGMIDSIIKFMAAID